MPTITLPDGSERYYEHPVSVIQVAEDIGPGLAKATLAGLVGDKLVDADFIVAVQQIDDRVLRLHFSRA